MTGLTLRSPEGATYVFDPGALCLEPLTTGGPGGYARYEILHTPGDLAAWLGRSGLRLESVRVTDGELRAARGLRDALWRLAGAAAHDRPPRTEDVAALNRAARRAPLVPEIRPDGTRGWRSPATAGQALSTIARDAVELFTGAHAGRVRECAAHDCFLIFVDASRPGRRRWCAMERCGNRDKVRALRARKHSEETP